MPVSWRLVRFAPKADMGELTVICLLRAKSRQTHCNKRRARVCKILFGRLVAQPNAGDFA
jgi:hypothetical protein